jgi:hypothetical protein
MAIELFANGAQTTLASAITSTSATTLSVASAALFPAAGTFRLLIDSELLIVTGVSGTTFTVIRGAEGSGPATHSAGAEVTQIVTAQSARTGSLSTVWGGFRSTVAAAAWTWVNQGSASLIDEGGRLTISALPEAGANVHALVKAAPSVPYKITAVIGWMAPPANYVTMGLCFRQSSDGKLAVNFLGYNSAWVIRQAKFTNPTTYSADYKSTANVLSNPIVLRIADDGTNRISSFSYNGATFWDIQSVGRTDFLTADQVGWFTDSEQTTAPTGITLLSWEES